MLACPCWRERSRAIFGRLAALVRLVLHKALGYRHIMRVFMARLNSRHVSAFWRIVRRVSTSLWAKSNSSFYRKCGYECGDTYMINTVINSYLFID